MTKKYKFRCEETDEIVEFPFDIMMRQKYGFLEHDGMTYRRIHDVPRMKKSSKYEGVKAEILSDTLGFGQHQFEEFEADRKRHGFTGVEFVRDKEVPEFYQAKIDSVKEWRRYIKHRGLVDRNGRNGGGSPISPDQIEASARLIGR